MGQQPDTGGGWLFGVADSSESFFFYSGNNRCSADKAGGRLMIGRVNSEEHYRLVFLLGWYRHDMGWYWHKLGSCRHKDDAIFLTATSNAFSKAVEIDCSRIATTIALFTVFLSENFSRNIRYILFRNPHFDLISSQFALNISPNSNADPSAFTVFINSFLSSGMHATSSLANSGK